MRRYFATICALTMFFAACPARAGGSGLNVVVLVNQNSTNSMQLANDYCALRGVPPQNVLYLTHEWSGGAVSCSLEEFQDYMLSPLLAMTQRRGLSNQIQYVLLSMDLPYEVWATNGENSTTAALFYGFKPDTSVPEGDPSSCSLPDNSSNSFAFAEMPFLDSLPNTAVTNSFMAIMLTDTNLAAAEEIMTRGAASDSSFPPQPVYLAKTDDDARNVRSTEFDNAVFDATVFGGYSMLRTNTDSTGFADLLGFETGLANFSEPSNGFVPGAMADSLTSYGGNMFDNRGQTTLLAFLEAGAAMSYGTVIEPCNYTQKFPDPRDYFYQARGFSLAESYYQSVLNPYQGIMVGEPLAAPFARRGTMAWTEPTGALPNLSGRTNLQLQFNSAATNLPIGKIDLFVDGTWFQTITNFPPGSGDVLSVTLNGLTNTYTVPAGASLWSVTSNLAVVLNNDSQDTQVWATAWGDRIELQSLNFGVAADSVTLQAAVTNADRGPTTILTPARPTFVNIPVVGYHEVLVDGNPAVGDWLQISVTKTNGSVVTLAVTNTSTNAIVGGMLYNLLYGINATPALQSSDGLYADDFEEDSSEGLFILYAQSPGWAASQIQVTLTASPDIQVQPAGTYALQDNLGNLVPRNHLYVSAGETSQFVNWTLDTTQLPDGYHQFTAVAYEGTSVQTQTSATQSVLVQNTGLTASLNTLYGGSNTDVNATLQFSVTANSNNIQTIELFSTGGSLGIVSNQNSANFSIAGTNLGLGLHPFYAVVTDNSGHQFRTATTEVRLIGPEPVFTVKATYPPLELTWSATAGRSYAILSATNLLGPYLTNATVTPSNSMGFWMGTNNAAAQFYTIKTIY